MKSRSHPSSSILTAGFLALAVLVAAGCSIPIPQASADPTRFYVLTAPTTAPVPATAGARPVVHLREVEVATYLRARPIVVRRGQNEIEFHEYARWGEPIELGLGRVLREELLARGAAAAVLTPGMRAAGVTYDRGLKVRVLTAEGSTDGSIAFRAVWEIFGADGKGEPVARGDFRATNLRWDGKTEAELVAGLSQAVAGLAAEISAAIANK
jgi:uncharacterized lipoprotein YmbA